MVDNGGVGDYRDTGYDCHGDDSGEYDFVFRDSAVNTTSVAVVMHEQGRVRGGQQDKLQQRSEQASQSTPNPDRTNSPRHAPAVGPNDVNPTVR